MPLASPCHPVTSSPCHAAPRLNPRPSPLRTVGSTEHAQTLALKGHGECPVCGKMFVASAIVREDQEPITGEPLVGYLGPCVLFKMYCDHCDHIITQLRACDHAGHNVGAPIGSYGLIRGQRAIDVFLRLHPQAAGVAQS